MNAAELAQLIEEQGGEVGGTGQRRYLDPRTATTTVRPYPELDYQVEGPNPTPNWIINTRNGNQIVAQPQPDGTFVPVNTPKPPSAVRGTEGGAPIIMGGSGSTRRPTRLLTSRTIVHLRLPRAPGRTACSTARPARSLLRRSTPIRMRLPSGRSGLRLLEPRPTGSPRRSGGRASRPAPRDRGGPGRPTSTTTSMPQALREWVYKTQVQLPEKPASKRTCCAATPSRGATSQERLPRRTSRRRFPIGTRRVSGAPASRSGRSGPRQFPAGHHAVDRAQLPRPHLQGGRQQAERQYENQYLQESGFHPVATAQGVPYRMAGPAAPIAGVADDEEELKRLAAQLAGN